MEYAHILEMLDEYLDRLMQARQLLLLLEERRGTAKNPANLRKRQDASGIQRTPAKRTASKISAPKRVIEGGFVVKKEPSSELAELGVASETRRKKSLVEEKEMAVPSEIPAVMVQLQAAQPKRETRRRRPTPLPRALGGAVSATPVFISAEKVRQEQIQKAEAGSKEETAVEPPITAELLTQRWVQGLIS